MLTCHSCRKHILQGIIGDTIIISNRPAVSARPPHQLLQRTYYSSNVRFRQESSQKPWRQNLSSDSKPLNHDRESGETKRQQWLKSRGVRPPDKEKPPADVDFVIRKHLVYLKDPLKLADFIKDTLRSDDFETALVLVRAASKNMQCIVSWNHLLDWQLEKGRFNAAMTTYNEMKKRAQVPDAYTYTIIFRGASTQTTITPNILEKCLAIYVTMCSEISPVQPNIIHMNTLLKMCSRANNIEAMFNILGAMRRKRISTPNNLTYTTMLNGLRMSTLSDDCSDLTRMQVRENTHKALSEARRLWSEVMRLWIQGSIFVDEELVAAMGRMLLRGDEQDADDILSLVERTMDIPRQIPRRIAPPHELAPHTEDYILKLTDKGADNLDEGAPTHLTDSESGDDLFGVNSVPPKNTQFAYARPGGNSLSLLMAACLKLKSKDAASKYWRLFAARMKPDVENMHAYMRLLRVFRSSTETIDVLFHMQQQDLQYKTFRIAMSTCERDKFNPNSFDNAGKILQLMENSPVNAQSFAILTSYLQLAIRSPAKRYKTDEDTNLAQGRQIVRALDRLEPFVKKIRLLVTLTDPDLKQFTGGDSERFLAEFAELVRKMISATDQLLFGKLVTKEVEKDVIVHRSRLASFLSRRKFQNLKILRFKPLSPIAWGDEDKDNEDNNLVRTRYVGNVLPSKKLDERVRGNVEQKPTSGRNLRNSKHEEQPEKPLKYKGSSPRWTPPTQEYIEHT